MLDPCGPEMTAVFWAIVRSILCGVATAGLFGLINAARRRLLGEMWNYRFPEPLTTAMIVLFVMAVSILCEIRRQFG